MRGVATGSSPAARQKSASVQAEYCGALRCDFVQQRSCCARATELLDGSADWMTGGRHGPSLAIATSPTRCLIACPGVAGQGRMP